MTRHRIRLGSPALLFHDGFPLGNGSLGAMVRGFPGEETWHLNLDTLWSGGPVQLEAGPPDGTLSAIRRALRSGDHTLAHDHASALHGTRYSESYQPLGALVWPYADASGEGYDRVLDLSDAVASTVHDSYEVRSYVSHPDQVLCVTISGPPDWVPHAPPRFSSPHPTTTTSRDGGFVVTGRVPARVEPIWTRSHDGVTYASDSPDDQGCVPAGMGFAVAVRYQQLGPGRWQALVAATDGYRGWQHWPSADVAALSERAWAIVMRAAGTSPEGLLARHVADHQALFGSCDLTLEAAADALVDASTVETFFDLGRYLLIASSRPGTQPANLQGIWSDAVRPAWSSNWTTNINLQMNYWGADATGLTPCLEPLLELIDDLVIAGAATAQVVYGAEGACAHHNVDLWRLTAAAPGQPQWANWPSALSWLVTASWDRWLYSGGDERSLQPLVLSLSACARFLCDMLVPYSDADPRLVVSPSTSPEHRFRSQPDPQSPLVALVAGATLDQALATEVFTRLLLLREHVDADLVARVAAVVPKLRPVQVSEAGVLLEWDTDRPAEDPGHRHVSHLYGLYPGDQIDPAGHPLLEPARAALAQRLAHGGGGTGWSQAWILCLAARLGDAAVVEHSIEVLATRLTSESLLDLHPYVGMPGDVQFQIDGNFGAVAGIVEAFVRSRPDRIDLFNAVPPSWRAGALRGIRTYGGHEFSITWADGQLTSVSLTAGSTATLRVGCPDWRRELRVEAGRTYQL